MRILEIQARDSRPLTLWKNTEDAYAISSTTSGPVVLTEVALSPTTYWSPPEAWWDKWDTSRTVVKTPDSLERSILEGAGVEPTMQSNREALEVSRGFFFGSSNKLHSLRAQGPWQSESFSKKRGSVAIGPFCFSALRGTWAGTAGSSRTRRMFLSN